MNYKVLFSKAAEKDAKKIKNSHLSEKCKNLIEVIKINPFSKTPPFENLTGELKGLYSRRINIQHRLVYSVDEKERIIKVLRMWTHYE
jgi:toxin YoeB